MRKVFVLVIVSLLFVFQSCNQKSPEPVEEQVVVMEQPVELLYGLPVDSFDIIEGKIRRNQMLGTLLNDKGVSAKKIYEISLLPRDLFDVRKINYGHKYAIFSKNNEVQHVVYEKDKVHYAVLHLEDSVRVDLRAKPIVTKTHEVEGVINSSLWNAFVDGGSNPMLANDLSEVYAWSIDFFGLQAGDRFKVIYDESYVDSVSVGIGQIHGAWFYHAGHEFWAIPFVQDSVRSFFDEEGNSLRKAFLKAPLKYSRISSGFSNSRLHPILKIRRPHHGVDYAAPIGTPVHAIGDGQVIARAYQRGGGNYVKIKHNGTYTTAYLHLSKFGAGVHKGAYVKQGDVIGYVGSSGLSTGPHLDFRFYKNGQAIDPLKVEAPPVEPVHADNVVDFDLVRNSIIYALSPEKVSVAVP